MSQLYLGFDFGMKRIGVAAGQTVTQSARPISVIPAKQGEPEWFVLDKLVQTWQPQAFVVGIPLKMDGTEQNLTDKARYFAQALNERYRLPVYEADERLTSKAVRERLYNEGGFRAIQKAEIDSLAAQMILQCWLVEHGTK